jgi:hypothetical protein
MKRKNLSINQGRVSKSVDQGIVEALANLKKLSGSIKNRPQVKESVIKLRQRGISRALLAECSGVTTRTITNWLSSKSKVGRPPSAVGRSNQKLEADCQLPQMKILDVVRPPLIRAAALPKISLRAEWKGFRFNIELI